MTPSQTSHLGFFETSGPDSRSLPARSTLVHVRPIRNWAMRNSKDEHGLQVPEMRRGRDCSGATQADVVPSSLPGEASRNEGDKT